MYPLCESIRSSPFAKPQANRGRRGRGRGRPGAKGRGRGRGVALVASIADDIHEGDAGVDTLAPGSSGLDGCARVAGVDP